MSAPLSVTKKAEIAARVRAITDELAAQVMSVDAIISRTACSSEEYLLRHPNEESDRPFGGWAFDSESMIAGLLTSAGGCHAIEVMQESWQEMLLELSARMATPDVILRSTMRFVLRSSSDLLVHAVLEQVSYDQEYEVNDEDIWDVASGIWRELKRNTPQ